MLVAAFSTLRSSREVVERYVSVWEEEIARNLLLKGDAALFEKVRAQIMDLASDVNATGIDATIQKASERCFAEQNLNITLYGTPAGELRICRSAEKLFLKSLVSPVFAFGSLAGILIAMWLARRSGRERAARDLNELAVRVAHDIRSPLTALKLATGRFDTSLNASDSGAHVEVKNLIEAATVRIGKIADDLLLQNRTIAKSKTSEPIKAVQTSIRELVNEKRMLAPNEMVFEIRDAKRPLGLEPARSSDEFERIIANLLQNAIEAVSSDAASEKTPRVIVDTVETAKTLSVTIRDNGMGIPRDVLPRIGESGFSFGKDGGNGIGLASARRWAKSRGGDLAIRSLEGTGTEVRLTIPR